MGSGAVSNSRRYLYMGRRAGSRQTDGHPFARSVGSENERKKRHLRGEVVRICEPGRVLIGVGGWRRGVRERNQAAHLRTAYEVNCKAFYLLIL
jgi:hypothetical protein